ncbi:hypothetical protein AB1E18_007574 [Capra hircus]
MLRHLLLVLEESEVTSLVLHFSRNALGALMFLLCQLAEKVAYILLNHTIKVEIEARREWKQPEKLFQEGNLYANFSSQVKGKDAACDTECKL